MISTNTQAQTFVIDVDLDFVYEYELEETQTLGLLGTYQFSFLGSGSWTNSGGVVLTGTYSADETGDYDATYELISTSSSSNSNSQTSVTSTLASSLTYSFTQGDTNGSFSANGSTTSVGREFYPSRTRLLFSWQRTRIATPASDEGVAAQVNGQLNQSNNGNLNVAKNVAGSYAAGPSGSAVTVPNVTLSNTYQFSTNNVDTISFSYAYNDGVLTGTKVVDESSSFSSSSQEVGSYTTTPSGVVFDIDSFTDWESSLETLSLTVWRHTTLANPVTRTTRSTRLSARTGTVTPTPIAAVTRQRQVAPW